MQRIRPLILALGLSAFSILPSAANPLTVAVSNFCEISKGTVLNDACAFFENGSATCALRFFDEKPCTFIVVARGDRGCGAWPELKVRFDGEELFKTRIASADWATYTFVSAVATGTHTVSVCFENDCLTDGEDRNLFFSGLTILPAARADDPALLTADEYQAFLDDRHGALIRETEERIEAIRKGNLAVKVLDSQGHPVSNARVTVTQARHEFPFGTALVSDLFTPGANHPEAIAYRAQVKKYFNHAVTENALKWPDMEPKKDEVHYEVVDAMAGWCRANGISLRGHCLFWSCFMPEWANALSDVDLRFAIMRRARNVVGHYRGLINEFDVSNEMLHCTNLNQRLGDSIFRQMCAEASGANPDAVLYVNDYGILEGDELGRYEDQIRHLLEMGAPVGGIGVQAHFSGAADPGHIQRSLDSLAKFNLPVKITEFDCVAADEAVQARTLEDVYRIAFAHEAVDGILMWGFWEKRHWKPEAAILRADFSRKPSGEMYEQLVFSNWWTRAEGQTSAEGLFSCRAFFGDLNVTVKPETGSEVRQKVALQKSAGEASVEIRLAEKPAETSKPDVDPLGYSKPVQR